jgi:hypothetical protein
MSLVEIPLFSELLPSGFSLLSYHISFLKLYLHFVYFGPELIIFVFAVSYHSNLDIMECALLLELMPFLLENIECLIHIKFLHEVPNEVIDNYVLG